MCEYGCSLPVRLNERSFRGGKTAMVDKCIAPVIQRMQDAGLRTSSCCCGHGTGASLIIWEEDAKAAVVILKAAGHEPRVKQFKFRGWAEINW